MASLETVANPAGVTTIILLACVLGIGFMVLFFLALAGEKKSTRPSHALRPRGVNCQADIACAAAPSRMPAVSPAAYVAMGVVRITTALASDAGRRNNDLSFDRLHMVGLDRAKPRTQFPRPPSLSLEQNLSRTGEPEYARHYFRRSNNRFLSDFYRVCEVLRSHSLR
jgi:hypothetical protein